MFMRGYKLSQQACVATVLSLEGHSTQKRHPLDAVFSRVGPVHYSLQTEAVSNEPQDHVLNAINTY